MDAARLKAFVDVFGQRYSEILRIALSKGSDEEIFKWFLASILFGAPIRDTSAMKTYEAFEKHGVLTSKRILETGWDGLVKILDEGGYTRYDFKTADKLLEVMGNLEQVYQGSLIALCREASDARDLEKRVKSLGKGVGEVTVNIFLRDLRDGWQKADPEPSLVVIQAAKNLGVLKQEKGEEALPGLKKFWRKNGIRGKSFVDFETALVRFGKDFCRKGRSAKCSFKKSCPTQKAT